MPASSHPKELSIDRAAATLRVTWGDGQEGEFPLRWLRANCPCATCREERRNAAMQTDQLLLRSGPLPSVEIAGAELVGNYALRLQWRDGHDTGIYAFSTLYEAFQTAEADPERLPDLLPD